jgi:predicted small secreted protein
MVRKIILALGIVAASLTASACNPVMGAGPEVDSVGEAGDRAI